MEERIHHLEEVNRYTLDALEMAVSIGDFQTNINKLQDTSVLLSETISRVQRLIQFQTTALFLVDEDTKDIFLDKVEPENNSTYIQNEVDFLIENDIFAWALREKRPVIVSSKDYEKKIILHVMATSSRIRGMFVGLLEKDKTDIPDISLSLLSIVLLNSANALESFELYNMIREKGETLKQAYEELKSTQAQLIQSGKLASIGELASGVAHELNQPLMAIRGTAQLLIRNLRKNNFSMDELVVKLEPIERNTKRMMNIINHLRIFSRQPLPNFVPLDVNRVIEDSFLIIGEQLRILNIEVEKNLESGLKKIRGEANQLEQVFLNLITNARDAIVSNSTKEMGNSEFDGKLEIVTRVAGNGYQISEDSITNSGLRIPDLEKDQATSHEQRATNNDQLSTRHIEILIKDTGCGIPEGHLKKIFDPFFTTKEVGKGTGLGLSISYGIIKEHNGEINVAETGPEGTTFSIKLPIENR